MFMKKYNWLFIYLLILSIIFLFFMNSFYSMWIFMELNLMLFVSLLIFNSIFTSDKSMKYFLLNSFSSMIFFFFMNMNMIFYNLNYLLIMNIMMLIKLGIFPFHFWFIDMLIQLDWMMCYILSTLQKIIPMIILFNIYIMNFITIMILMSGLFSSMMIFNQILLKKILGYSSINHLSWLLMSLMISMKMLIIYFFSYLMINFMIMFMLWKFNLNEINQLYMFMMNMNFKFYLLMMMFSLGGIPPFFGFFMKWFFLMNLSLFLNWLIMFILIFYSLIFLYYYMRLIYNYLLLFYLTLNLNFFSNFLIKEKNFNYIFFMNLFISINILMYFMWIFF